MHPLHRPPRLGLIGTFVWDTVWTLDDQRAGHPTEGWGGVAYSLAAAAAACPPAWRLAPIARVGADLAEQAFAFAAALPGVECARLQPVPEPNNRVELRYRDGAARGERLTGGVPAWEWPTLAPLLEEVDALYVNFLSGFEMTLEAAERLRDSFAGPIYADLHSLFLGCPGAGARRPRRLPDAERWLRCFHAVQLNQEEFALLGESLGGDLAGPEDLLGEGPGLVALTRGAAGASVATRLPEAPEAWPSAPADAPARVVHTAPREARPGDPTGCGDVWGATFFCRLLAGDSAARAADTATVAAAHKLAHRGADGLVRHLAGVARRHPAGVPPRSDRDP